MENQIIFVLACGFVLGVLFFYYLCELLIQLETRRIDNKSARFHRLKEIEMESIKIQKTMAPSSSGVAPLGYIPLPMDSTQRTDTSNVVVDGTSVAVIAKLPGVSDPRSADAWKKSNSDSKNSFGSRKDDPWENTSGGKAPPVASGKKSVEESVVVAEKLTPTGTNAPAQTSSNDQQIQMGKRRTSEKEETPGQSKPILYKLPDTPKTENPPKMDFQMQRGRRK